MEYGMQYQQFLNRNIKAFTRSQDALELKEIVSKTRFNM